MSRILVVGEDALSCALGERLVRSVLPSWQLAGPSINTRGVTKLVAALPRYLQQAKYMQPMLCVADTDGRCVLDLLANWLQGRSAGNLILRFAVTEAESWLLADREGFSKALSVPLNKLPNNPDSEHNPKRLVLNLAKRSRDRRIRDEVVSSIDPSKPGTGYNVHLSHFVRTTWESSRAAECSASLAKAVHRLKGLH